MRLIRPRRRGLSAAPALLALAVGLASCVVKVPGQGVPAAEPSAASAIGTSGVVTGAPISGTITGQDPGASPTVSPTGPAATPLPTLPPQTVRAVEVTVLPRSATLNRPAREGAQAIHPSSIQLAGKVLLANGLETTEVIWRSTDPAVATVGSDGLVMAGNKVGTIAIVATSQDGEASASATITLTDLSGAEIVVD